MSSDTAMFETDGQRKNDAPCTTGELLESTGLWSFMNTERDIHLSHYSLPLFFVQITLAVVVTHIFLFLLKPLRQPHIIPFILGGIVVGSSFLGQWSKYEREIFPVTSLVLLESTGLLGLIYYFFVLGVSMDLTVIKATWKKSVSLALIDFLVTVFIAVITYLNFRHEFPEYKKFKNDISYSNPIMASVLLGVAASMTGFPVLNRILLQLRLTSSDIGMIAASCSIFETALALILLPAIKALTPKLLLQDNDVDPLVSESNDNIIDAARKRINHKGAHWVTMAPVWSLLSSIMFAIICFFVFRPAIRFGVRRTPDGSTFNDLFIKFILLAVMFSGFVTDLMCCHLVLGPLLLGLAISRSPLGTALIAKVEDIAYWVMLPLYFVVIGFRTHLETIFKKTSDIIVEKKFRYTGIENVKIFNHPFLIIFFWASLAKMVITLIFSKYFKMQHIEGIVLGLLLNTKGFIQLIVLTFGLDQEGLVDDGPFALAICFVVLITASIPPTIRAIHKPIRHFGIAYKRRSVQKSRGEPQLRILPCFHHPRNVPSIINLLGVCQPTKKSPFVVYALHLLELTAGQNQGPSTFGGKRTTSLTSGGDKSHPQSEPIVRAFKNFEQAYGGSGALTVHNLTTVSPYSLMHEELCEVADDKGIALIILPFHKHQTIDGGMEETSPFFRDINDNIMNNAPCTVAILVDRGFRDTGGSTRNGTNPYHIGVLFFGGPDDREALAIAVKMAENPNVMLTVVRFIPTDEALKMNDSISDGMGVLKLIIDNERERQRDDDYICSFKVKNSNKLSSSIAYIEKEVNDGEETMNMIKSIEDNLHDLFIVGRGRGMLNPLTSSLLDFSECPELGAIGDLFASPDFSMTATSVLIVQQYVGVAGDGGSSGSGTPSSQYSELYDTFHNFNQVSPSSTTVNGNLAQRRVKKFSTDWV